MHQSVKLLLLVPMLFLLAIPKCLLICKENFLLHYPIMVTQHTGKTNLALVPVQRKLVYHRRLDICPSDMSENPRQ